MERRVIIILGPTCSGKTSLSLQLAKSLSTEIISADSRQIYMYLDIGTAKPSQEDLISIPHHFVNTLDPSIEFNVSKFEDQALSEVEKLHKRKKIPIVVGGSGLYIKAIVDGIFNEVDTDLEFRKKILEERNKFGNEFVYKKLVKVDKKSADTMIPQNWKRVIRALEVFHITGEPIWKFHGEHKRKIDIDFLQYGLLWDRDILYQNIEARVDKMIESGLEAEVSELIAQGYSQELNSLNTVGYKEMISYLNGEYDLERAIELIKRNSRRYAKRQLTWFNKDKRIKWIPIKGTEDIDSVAQSITSDL